MQNSPSPSDSACGLRRRLTRLRRRVRAVFEGFLVRRVRGWVARLSRRGEHRLAAILAWMMCRLHPRARRIALANLDIVFGAGRTRREKRQIYRESCLHAARILLDYFWFSRHTDERIARHCRAADAEMERWLAGDFPGLMVTAHLGNWELGGLYAAWRGRSMWSVYRPIGASQTRQALLDFRGASGQRVIARAGAVTGMMRALRSRGLVALVLDQHTDPDSGGIYLDFFGLPAAFSSSAGVIAHRMKIPICIACSQYDRATDTYVMTPYRTLDGEETGRLDPREITRVVVSTIEAMILDNPGQWLWCYRRWKRYRPQDDRARFPFYATLDLSVLDHPS